MIRAGIISTAGINYSGFILPVLNHPDITLSGIASRCLIRAQNFAQKHNIPKAYGSYQEILDDPEIDVIYISIPNAFHVEWVIKSLEAGKHVLCEKPISHTYQDAVRMKNLAQEKDLLLFDALHYNYHPVMKQILEALQSGHLGEIEYMDVHLGYPTPPEGNIRYQPSVLGGAFMHMGCYCGHFIRNTLGNGRLTFKDLYHKRHPHGADMLCRGKLSNDQHPGEFWFRGSLLEEKLCSRIYIRGHKGEMIIHEPFNPVLHNGTKSINVLAIEDTKRTWDVESHPKSTYAYQLDAFISCLKNGDLAPHVDLETCRFVEDGRILIYGSEIPKEH